MFSPRGSIINLRPPCGYLAINLGRATETVAFVRMMGMILRSKGGALGYTDCITHQDPTSRGRMQEGHVQRAFWFSFTAALAVYGAMILWSLPFITAEAGGLRPFDIRPFGYNVHDARAFLSALSDTGRMFYLGTQHQLDLIYPALLALTLVLGAQILYRAPISTVLGLLALMGAASDYLENYLVAAILRAGVDDLDARLVSVAGFWTISKSVTTALCIIALLVGLTRLLWRRMMR